MKQHLDPWLIGMTERFFNLEDACCPMGSSLKPIGNLVLAVEALKHHRKVLEHIGTPEALKALDKRF